MPSAAPLHFCCKNLHLTAQVLHEATPKTLLSFATWAHVPTKAVSRQAIGLQLLLQPAESFPPLIVWHFIRRATDPKLEKPLGEAQPAAQSHPCLPSVGGHVTLCRWCYSCQPTSMNWLARICFASSKERSPAALIPGELHLGACTSPRGLRAQFTVN